MANILQGLILWTGYSGGPGYVNLYTRRAGIITSNVDNMMTAMNKFCLDLQSEIPTGQTVTPQNEIKEIDEVTGVLVSLQSSAVAPVPKSGGAPSSFAAGVGACISWGTGGINRGKRVRGRTFVVPLSTNAYDAQGTLGSGTLTVLNTAATNWRTSSAYETVVWSRPRLGAGGVAFPILSHNVKDRTAMLRSRRA